jgi:hypothetical protein
MDLLRFEDKDVGPVFIDGRFLFVVTADPLAGEITKIGAHAPYGCIASLDILGDVDEIAAAIERAVPGARIHRIV